MTLDLVAASEEVVILGGGALVGRALELLLRSADYNVKFMAENSLDELGLLEGCRLLIVAPGVSAKCRESILALAGSRTTGARLSVLELLCNDQEPQGGAGYFLPWPCRTEELKRYVKAILLGKSEVSQDGQGPQTPRKGKEMAIDKGPN